MSKLIDGVAEWPDDLAQQYRDLGLWRGRSLYEATVGPERQIPGDRIAVIDGSIRIGYAELTERAEAAAARLSALGLRPGDRLLVQLPNCWQFVVLLLACLREGIAPVLTLPAHRQLELTGIAEVSQATAIAVADRIKDFDHRALADQVAAQAPSIEHILVTGGELVADHIDLDALLAPGPPTSTALPDSSEVAVFLLSGGTTGTPKLITRTNDDYAYNAYICGEIAELSEDSVYLVSLPAAHNFPLACPGLLGTLSRGGRVVLLPSPEPKAAMQIIAEESVTITAVVPAVAQRWIDHVEEHRPTGIDSLEVLQVGGSRMPDEIAVRVEPVLGARLQQVFGMAEGLINMTRLDDPIEVITTTQGRPVSEHDQVQVVDADGQEVPDGVRGSILTRGAYTPRGYFRAPEANARSFIDGWYSSGDVVERRPDGNLIVHGRDKDLINRGGEKISAEELESLAYRVPAIELAAAVAMPDPELGERVCLFVMVRDGTQTTLDEVRDAMRAAGIAAYKLPERLEIVDTIPMTKVGKLDKKQLRETLTRTAATSPQGAIR